MTRSSGLPTRGGQPGRLLSGFLTRARAALAFLYGIL